MRFVALAEAMSEIIIVRKGGRRSRNNSSRTFWRRGADNGLGGSLVGENEREAQLFPTLPTSQNWLQPPGLAFSSSLHAVY